MNSYEMKLHGQYLEPGDSKSYGKDWNGNDIYDGDEYFDIDGELVKVEDAEEYLKTVYVTRTAGGMIGNEIT